MIKILILLLITIIGCAPQGTNETSTIDNQIIYGEQVFHNEYPSIVALTIEYYPYAICTGTLIKNNLVMTAAHCVEDFEPWEYNIVHGYEYPELAQRKGDVHKVHSHIIHELYNPKDITFGSVDGHDIALIFLKFPISGMTEAEILPKSMVESALQEGTNVFIAGYGQTMSPKQTASKWLPDADPAKETRFPYGGVLYAAETELNKRSDFELWIGTEKDAAAPQACYGDSGGPLYVDYEEKRYVAGVTSRLADYPVCEGGSVYTLASAYENWIDEKYEKWLNRPEPDPTAEISEEFIYEKDAGISVLDAQSDVKQGGSKPVIIYIENRGCSFSNSRTNNYFALLMLLGILIGRRHVGRQKK